jgi:hypothetical protein
MNENKIIKLLIVTYWMLFYGTTVIDKIIPDVYPLWVGTDFYTLFVKFFASLGILDPIFPSLALVFVSILEIIAFVCFLLAFLDILMHKDQNEDVWFYRGVGFAILTFSIFSVGDQVFGDRFTLLEHTIFWIILIFSWVIVRYISSSEEKIIRLAMSKGVATGLVVGLFLFVITSISLFHFSKHTMAQKIEAVHGVEVTDGVYKFDLPFLADKITVENTLKDFEESHKDLNITYIYTGPDELNAKKKTHMLLYVFTENKSLN